MDLSKFGVEVKEKPEENKFHSIDDKKLELDFKEIKSGIKFEETERYLPWFLKYQLN